MKIKSIYDRKITDRATACVGIGDDQIGVKNTESDGPTPWGKGLIVRRCEFPSPLISQEFPPLLWEISDVIYHFLFWPIIFLHLLVIHAHT